MKRLENIKVEGYRGTWYELYRVHRNGIAYAIMEHQQYGDEAEPIVIRVDTLEQTDEDTECDILY